MRCSPEAATNPTLSTLRKPVLLAVLLTIMLLPATRVWAQDPDARGLGVGAQHGSFSLAPWEHIDPFTGNALLAFTDIVLPGNAGFNLTVRRYFNTKSPGWTFDFGFPAMSLQSGRYPVINLLDGTVIRMLRQTNPDVYLTTSYWRYTASTRILELPNGTSYQFNSQGNPQWMRDAFGNQIDVVADPNCPAWRVGSLVQHLGQGQDRTLAVGYDQAGQAGRITSITVNGRTWQYVWGAVPQNLQAISPTGATWSVAHEFSIQGGTTTAWTTVTTPTGGWVKYTSVTHSEEPPDPPDPFDLRWNTTVVTQRQSGGTDVPAGTWAFSYWSGGSVATQSTGISGPGGFNAVYTYSLAYNPSWEGDIVHELTSSAAGTQSSSTSWTSCTVPGLPEQDGYGNYLSVKRAPSPGTVTTTLDGRPYQRVITYDCSRFGVPSTVDDSGDFTRATTYGYQAFNGSVYLADAPSSVTVGSQTATMLYDSNTGFMTSRTAAGLTTTFSPNAYGNVAGQTVGGVQTTTFDYSWGVVSGIHAPQSTVLMNINADGTVASRNQDGHTTSYGYDTAGRLTSVQPPVGSATTTSYASDYRSVTVTRGTAWATTSLDGLGRTIGTANSAGIHADTVYDAMGRVVESSLPYTTARKGVSFTYDDLGRVTSRTNPDQTSATYQYDSVSNGLRTRTTDEKGRLTTKIVQASGSPRDARLAFYTDAANQTTSYSYNDQGSLTGTTLVPNNLTKTWTYDANNRLATQTQPESGTTTFTYDGLGRLWTRTDALGHVTTYNYDPSNRVIGVSVPWDSAYSTTIAYDVWGNRTSAANGYVTSSFQYDAGNRLTQRTDVIKAYTTDPSGQSFVTQFALDDSDNVTDIWYPSGSHVKYAYDGSNRLSRVYDEEHSFEFAGNFAYHPSGGIASFTSGNGIVNTVDYDDRYRPSHVTAGPALDLTYTYDNVGNVTGIADPRTTPAAMSATYGYDALDRLTTATGPWGALTYDYDAIGNRTQQTRNGTTTSYSYSPLTNQLTGTSGGQAEAFTYDDAGRLAADGRGTYTYTPASLLQTATMGTGTLQTYRYDADGQRVLKITGSGTSRTYIVNGLSEFSPDGNGNLQWNLDYIYAGSRLLTSLRPGSAVVAALTVQKAGGGTGTVTSVPDGISCGDTCQATLPAGTTVRLTANAGVGSRFVGWTGTGDCAQPSSESPRTLVLVQPTTCTATFNGTHPLTVTRTGASSDAMLITSTPSGILLTPGGNPMPTAEFDAGTTVQLHAQPPQGGFVFLGWTGDGCTNDAGAGEGHVLMDRERTCTTSYALAGGKQAPANGASWIPTSVWASWTQIGAIGDVGYWVCIDQTNNNSCDTWWQPNGSWPSKEFENLAPGTYYWQVKVDLGGFGQFEMNNGAWWNFTVGAQGGATFGKSSPGNGAGGQGSAVTLTWQALSGAPGYEVCWDTTDNGTCDGTWQSVGTATSFGLTNLAPGTYYWQVRAGGTVLADGGAWWHFTVPIVFGKQGPANGATWMPSTVWSSWTAVPEAGYWVCLDQTDNNSCDTYWWPNGGTTVKPFENLAPGTYYWQVRAQVGTQLVEANEGAWWHFTVGPPPGTSFVKTTPGNGATLSGATAYLGWNASGAPGYEVCWDTTDNAACDGSWQSVGAATTLTLTNLATGTHYWQVRAAGTEADNGAWWSFTVPVHLTKVSPANGATGLGSDVWTTWTLIPEAGYWVCVDQIDNGVCDTYWWPNGSYTSRLYDGLAPGTYYWQALSDMSEPADGGVWWSFTVSGEGGAGPRVAGGDLWPGAWSTAAPTARVPPHCATDGTTVWCTVRAEFEAGRHRIRFHPVPGLAIWVDGNLQASALAVGRHGVTSVDVDLSAGTHVVQWQYDARALPSTVAPAPSWHRAGPMGGPSGGPPGSVSSLSVTPDGVSAGDAPMPLVEGEDLLVEPDLLDVVAPPPAGEGVIVEHYHLDALGSVRAVTDAAGNVIAQHDFLPFGEEFSPQNPPVDRKLFTGQERDFETGLDYFNARQLRPDLGRFLTPDPLGVLPLPTSAQDFNAYDYVVDNPLSFVDPSGLAETDPNRPHPFEKTPDWSPTSLSYLLQTRGDLTVAFWTGSNIFGDLTLAETNALNVYYGGQSGERPLYVLDYPGGADAVPSLVVLATEASLSAEQPSSGPDQDGFFGRLKGLFRLPWSLSGIVPVWPVAGVTGVGPAFGVAYNPATHTLCGGFGVGLSAGHNTAIGPLTSPTSPASINSILAGWSASIGGNLPLPAPTAGLGWQGIFNSSGVAQGPTAGVVGISGSVTYSWCGRIGGR